MYLESDHGTRLVLSAGRCDAAKPSGSLVITQTRSICVQVCEKNLPIAPRFHRIQNRLLEMTLETQGFAPRGPRNEGVALPVKEKRSQAVSGAAGRRLLARRIPSRHAGVLEPHYLPLLKEPSFPHRANGAAAARNAVVSPSNPSSKKIR